MTPFAKVAISGEVVIPCPGTVLLGSLRIDRAIGAHIRAGSESDPAIRQAIESSNVFLIESTPRSVSFDCEKVVVYSMIWRQGHPGDHYPTRVPEHSSGP
jgi:hypothetical protein